MSETLNLDIHLGIARDTIGFLRAKREEDAAGLDTLQNRFDAMRRQRDGERSRARRAENRLATAEETVERVQRAVEGPHPANSGLDTFTLAHVVAVLRGEQK